MLHMCFGGVYGVAVLCFTVSMRIAFFFFLRQSGKGQAGISNLCSRRKISETQQRQKQKHSVTGLMFDGNVLILFLM